MILCQTEKNKNTWQISIPSDDIDNISILLDDIDFENIDIFYRYSLSISSIDFWKILNTFFNLSTINNYDGLLYKSFQKYLPKEKNFLSK
ncbi:hypothetical protein BpHYR1_016165 [Brachionus plicatilis]|uniref:Uncharacterized protein n=1 Tax=Brachionus plicatilis TaxID=10195 RepID=A0A3M7QK11_BRAPC|nr:hypothetical protein BpHYR1_016165 [Brachionus plicatilis]